MAWKLPVVALAVAFLCAGLSAAVGAVAAGDVSSNKPAAAVDATALLGRLHTPAGSTRSASEPSGAGPALANPGSRPGTANLADAHAWWIVPGTPAAATSFIQAHPPAGSRLIQSGSSNVGRAYQMVGYGSPARLHVLSTRWLVVEVVSLGDGRTAMRADAEVVWITLRPASERMPAGVTRLAVSVIRTKRIVAGPFTFTAHGPVHKVRALIDRLPAFQPGAFACPADFGTRVRLAFYGVGSKPLAVARVDPGGCGDVELTIAGKREPPLTSSAFPGSGRARLPSLVGQIDAALGIQLHGVNGP